MSREDGWIKSIQRSQSRRAADLLVSGYYDEIFAFTYRQLGNKEDAMDLTQEIFISMLKSIKSYDSKKAGFRTWLYHIAANKIIDLRRKRSNDPLKVDIEGLEIPDELDFGVKRENRELLGHIDGYVSGLENQLQQIFRLKLYSGLTFGQIGQALGLNEATVKSKYYRLIERVRKEFYHEYSGFE